jgi:hypothetical protein
MVELRHCKIRGRFAQDLIRPLLVTLQLPQSSTLLCGEPARLPWCAPPDEPSCAASHRRNRSSRRWTGMAACHAVLARVVEDHPHRPLPHFEGKRRRVSHVLKAWSPPAQGVKKRSAVRKPLMITRGLREATATPTLAIFNPDASLQLYGDCTLHVRRAFLAFVTLAGARLMVMRFGGIR